MPKIKLSALVSDIKGKAQGSVFARNNGGLYFRNNPSGGGQKTAKWAKAKSSFSALSGMWRDLLPEQRSAWNTATADYNSKDVFGDDRKASGFELFMRLNQPLNKLGLPLLETPQAPQEIPAVSDMVLSTVDKFLFTPFHAYAPYNCQAGSSGSSSSGGSGDPGQCSGTSAPPESMMATPVDGHIIEAIEGIISDLPIVFSTLVRLNESCICEFEGKSIIPLSAVGDEENRLNFYLEIIPGNQLVLRAEYRDATSEYFAESRKFSIRFGEPVRLGIVFSIYKPEDSMFFLNQEGIGLDTSSNEPAPDPEVDVRFDFVPKVASQYPKIAIQHSYFSNEPLSLVDISLLSYGYVVGKPLYMFDYAPTEDGVFINYGSRELPSTSRAPIVRGKRASFPRVDFEVAPYLEIVSSENLPSNYNVILKTTPMGSSGRIGTRSGFKRVYAEESKGLKLASVGKEFLKEFGAMINDGYIQAKVQYLNRTTGQLSPESLIEFGSLPENNGPNIFFGIIAGAACPLGSTLVNGSCISNTYLASPSKGGGKKRVKFKSGTDLSNGVN